MFQRGKEVTKVLIYGAGEMGVMARNALTADNILNFNIVGFVDDNPLKKRHQNRRITNLFTKASIRKN